MGDARPIEVDVLVAVEGIKVLKAQYFYFLDTKQWDRLRALFTPDATFDPAHEGAYTFDGLDGFIAGASGGLANAVSVHHGHMPMIELLDADHARGVWAMTDDVAIASDPPRRFVGKGHYHETYRREDGAWRIASWKLTRLRVDVLD
jgi:hypothetical protein